MNTKTMRLPPRRLLTPSNNKRKEGDGFDSLFTPSHQKSLKLAPSRPGSPQPARAANPLLAGYLAHEFLTKGTLLGEPFEPSREAEPEKESDKRRRYLEISSLLRTSGAHLPGIVNPAQLATDVIRWKRGEM